MLRKLLVLLLAYSQFLHSMNPSQLMRSLVPCEELYLVPKKERYKFPIPTYYKNIFAKFITGAASKEALILETSWEDVRDLAQTLNDLDQHKLSSAIKRCQEKPQLIEQLENMGLQKQLLQPIAFWTDITQLNGQDNTIAQLFLQYRQDLESANAHKQATPLTLLSTRSVYNPYLLLLKKQIKNTVLTITNGTQTPIFKLSNKKLPYNLIEQIEVSVDGLFFVSKIGNSLYLLETQTESLISRFEPKELIQAFTVMPNNNVLVATPSCFYIYHSKWQLSHAFKHNEYNISCVAISPNGKFFAVGREDGNIGVYAWQNEELVKSFTGCRNDAKVNTIIIKQDNDTIMVADENSTLSFYSFKAQDLLESRYLDTRDCAVKKIILLSDEEYMLVEDVSKIIPPHSPQFSVHPAGFFFQKK